MQGVRSFGARFGRDRSGTVAIIFSLSLVLLCMTTGLAIDGSRAYSVSTRVVAVLDAAALAGAKLLDTEASDAEVRSMVQAYFDAHTANMRIGGENYLNFDVVFDRTNASVTVSVDIDMPTSFGHLAGIDSFQFNRNSTVVFSTRQVELAMVLDVTGSMKNYGKIDSLKIAAKDVIDTLIPNATSSSNAVKIGLAPYSAALNAGAYAAAASGGASVDKCVFERDGIDAYTDASPGSGRYLSAMADPSHPTNNYYACPNAVLVPLTNDTATLKSKIDSYSASGRTAGHIGMAWGWYLISPNWASFWPSKNAPAPYSEKIMKAVILMTDGEFNTSYKNGPINATSADQAQSLCTNMKAAGVIVYTVAFDAPSAAEALLRSCASSSDQFFTAASETQLRAAFSNIAANIISRSLRIKS